MTEIKYRRDLWKLLPEGGTNAVEVGVAEGLFSADMLRWQREGIEVPVLSMLYMVDRWQSVRQKGDASNPQAWHDKNYQEALERVRPFGARAALLRGPSVEMARLVPDQSLGLVYIDADHSFEGCSADIDAWLPKLYIGGIMAFHDYLNPAYGVKRAVDQFGQHYKYEVHVISEDKTEDAGAYTICY